MTTTISKPGSYAPSLERRQTEAAEVSASAQDAIARALWETHNEKTPLVDALNHIGAGLHRIADAMEKRDDG